jgi:AAA+ superfamily predicted ATPase
MRPGEDALQDLRDAMKQSPENVPLRQHVSEILLRRGLLEEAEVTLRDGLRMTPASDQLKLGLARCYYLQGKNAASVIIVDELLQRPAASPHAHLLHSRLLLRIGDLGRALAAYRRAIDADGRLADPDLAEALGLHGPDAAAAALLAGDAAAGTAPPPAPSSGFTFADVAGLDPVKDAIRMRIIHPLRQPELCRAYGKSIGGGVLLYGPPGCGKTLLARAAAGEVCAGFLAVGLHEVLDMYLGRSEQKLHDLFVRARRQRPCILFFDEVDALGASRTDLRFSPTRHLVNQFLSELDAAHQDNEGLLVLAATNAPWHLDPALRRPGRFDRVLFVPPPDAATRAQILRQLLRGKPAEDIDHERLAHLTADYSGADLKAVVEQAADEKLRAALECGSALPLTTADLVAAAGRVRPSTREWFATARNFALFANHAGAYDDVLHHLDRAS